MRARLLGAVGNAGIEHEVVHLVTAEFLKNLLGECLDRLEVVELQRQDRDAVGAAVKGEAVVGLLGGLLVTGAEDDAVRLCLLEKLLDGLEALVVDCE